MPDEVIPEDVGQFVLDNIDTVAQLEGLLLLRSSNAKVTVREISQRLYISEEETNMFLQQLAERGFLQITKQNEYEYHPRTSEISEMMEKVAQTYARYLVPMTHLIHSKHKSRVRKFADAFRIRKE